MHRKPRCERRRGQARYGPETKPEGSVPHGTCTTMCPISEVRRRETQRQLHRFELEHGTGKERIPRADLSRTVKEYSRPAAGKDSTRACDLRPPDVLFKTTCYLVDEIAASPTLQPWTEVSSCMRICYIVRVVASNKSAPSHTSENCTYSKGNCLIKAPLIKCSQTEPRASKIFTMYVFCAGINTYL